MHHRPQPLRLRFAASCRHLLRRHRRLAARPQPGRTEYLDHVGAIGLELAHALADLVERQLWVRDGFERSQYPRPRDLARVDRVPQQLVGRRADALYRGKSRTQCRPRVRLIRIRSELRVLTLFVRNAGRPVMPVDVHMRIDPTRHDGQPTQIDIARNRFRARIFDADDLAALHGDTHVVLHVPAPIQKCGRK